MMRARSVGRIALFVVVLIAAALGLLFSFAFMKEGSSWSDLPILLGIIAAELVVAAIWWIAVGRSFGKALFGWIFLALPIAVDGTIAAGLLYSKVMGPRLAAAAKIENFRQSLITWPGFDGPVGMQISFDLVHPHGISALIRPPQIRMAPKIEIPPDQLSYVGPYGGGYFSSRKLNLQDIRYALLKTVANQRLYKNPRSTKPYRRWSFETRFDLAGRTSLTYHLLPGAIESAYSTSYICLPARIAGVRMCKSGADEAAGCNDPQPVPVIPPTYSTGSDLTALWPAFGSSDMVIDLSHQLTEAMRNGTQLQADPGTWQAMQQRFEPAGLARAGYKLCPPGKNVHTSTRTCYCRTP